MNSFKKIDPESLLCMDGYCGSYPYVIDLAYAQPDNYLFKEAIYRPDAQFWLHEMLADVVFHAANLAHDRYGLTLVLYDGLRTSTAQAKMLETEVVKQNPHWLEKQPQLLSNPGEGGHPRAMAVDVSLRDENGEELDFGTPFDFLAEDPTVAGNPAHRDYAQTPEVTENRRKLDDVMVSGAAAANIPLFLLPQEWWDFRLPPELYTQYAPLSDDDLPPDMRLL